MDKTSKAILATILILLLAVGFLQYSIMNEQAGIDKKIARLDQKLNESGCLGYFGELGFKDPAWANYVNLTIPVPEQPNSSLNP